MFTSWLYEIKFIEAVFGSFATSNVRRGEPTGYSYCQELFALQLRSHVWWNLVIGSSLCNRRIPLAWRSNILCPTRTGHLKGLAGIANKRLLFKWGCNRGTWITPANFRTTWRSFHLFKKSLHVPGNSMGIHTYNNGMNMVATIHVVSLELYDGSKIFQTPRQHWDRNVCHVIIWRYDNVFDT